MAQNDFVTTPGVLKESAQGFSRARIEDEMFDRREVECVGEIDADKANSLCLQLRYLKTIDPGAPITMVINSPGGSVLDGLAIYDVMRAIRCPIRTICLGNAASMGAVLFIAGDQRDMLPHSKILIHDPLIPRTGGSALELKSVSDDLMRTRQIMAEIIADRSGKTVEEVLEATRKDAYMEAEQAVAWGLADRIIDEL